MLTADNDRLLDVIHAEARLSLIFEFCDNDLKRVRDVLHTQVCVLITVLTSPSAVYGQRGPAKVGCASEILRARQGPGAGPSFAVQGQSITAR